jgi:hypothetical protein
MAVILVIVAANMVGEQKRYNTVNGMGEPTLRPDIIVVAQADSGTIESGPIVMTTQSETRSNDTTMPSDPSQVLQGNSMDDMSLVGEAPEAYQMTMTGADSRGQLTTYTAWVVSEDQQSVFEPGNMNVEKAISEHGTALDFLGGYDPARDLFVIYSNRPNMTQGEYGELHELLGVSNANFDFQFGTSHQLMATPTPLPTPKLTPLDPKDMKRMKNADMPCLVTGTGYIDPDDTTLPQSYYYRGDVVPIKITVHNTQPTDYTSETLEFTLCRELDIAGVATWPVVYQRYTGLQTVMPAGESTSLEYILQIPERRTANLWGAEIDTAGLYQVRIGLYDSKSRQLISALTFKVNIL